jgi:hypothetical protein
MGASPFTGKRQHRHPLDAKHKVLEAVMSKNKKTWARGTPAHVPTEATRQAVSLHATVGTTHETIAQILGIHKETLYKYYTPELTQSREKANASVGGALFKKAMAGDTTAMIFWMKTRARWKETVDVSNDDGSLKHEPVRDLAVEILKAIHAKPAAD